METQSARNAGTYVFAELADMSNPDFASWYESKLSAATTARDNTLAAYRERAGE